MGIEKKKIVLVCLSPESSVTIQRLPCRCEHLSHRAEGCFFCVQLVVESTLSRGASQDDISSVVYDLNAKSVLVSTCFW